MSRHDSLSGNHIDVAMEDSEASQADDAYADFIRFIMELEAAHGAATSRCLDGSHRGLE